MSGNWALAWVRGGDVDALGWAAIVLVVAWLLIGDPASGRRGFARLLAALAAGDENERVRLYRRWSWQSWLLAAVVIALALEIIGWTPAQLGLRWPAFELHFGGGFVVGAVAAAVAGMSLGIVVAKRRAGRAATTPKPMVDTNTLAMLPRTAAERRGFAWLAITAGISEEIVWRGFLLAALVALLPTAPAWLLLLVMSAMFGWAHLYQGRNGVFITAILGGILGGIYLATASLVLPIILHAAIDLRAMLVPLPAAPNNDA